MTVAYDKITTRDNVKALMHDQQIVNEIIQGVIQGSTILPLMTKLPNMTSAQAKLNILNALPEAYWVSGDTGLKGTSSVAWKNKYLKAEEIAVVVPISDAVVADADYDIWAEIKPRVIEQFYKLIDKAIIDGTDKPTSWRDGLVPSITAVTSNAITKTTNLYNDISDAMSAVEQDGYDVTGILGGVALKGEFRKGLVDSTGQPLQNSDVTELPRAFAKNGAFAGTTCKAIVGDFKQAVFAIRQDIEFKMFDSGVITNSDGDIIYNLMQQDMKALRVTMRLGWELPNPVNVLNSDGTEATRLPFAYITA